MTTIDFVINALVFIIILAVAIVVVSLFVLLFFKFREMKIRKNIPSKFKTEDKNGFDKKEEPTDREQRGEPGVERERGSESESGDTGNEVDTIERDRISLPPSEDLKFD